MNTKTPILKRINQGFISISDGSTLHNNKLCNKAPKMTKVNNYATIETHGYKWLNKSVNKLWTNRNDARRYKLSEIQKALQTMLDVDRVKSYLSFEQSEHIKRQLYINQKELEFRTKLKKS